MIATVAAEHSSRVHCSTVTDTDGHPVAVCQTVKPASLKPRPGEVTTCVRCIAGLSRTELRTLIRQEDRDAAERQRVAREAAWERVEAERVGRLAEIEAAPVTIPTITPGHTDDTARPCRVCGQPEGRPCREDCEGWPTRHVSDAGEWFITWYRAGEDEPRLDRVQIIEGYTTLADAPKILALYHLGRITQARDVVVVSERRAAELTAKEADAMGLERPGRVCERAGHAWRMDDSTSHRTPSGRTIRQQRTCRRCGECDDVFIDGPTGRVLSFDQAQARLFDATGRTS